MSRGYRMKILSVTPRLLVDLLTEKRTSRCLKGVPEGTAIMYADPEGRAESRDVKILITHPSFPIVEGGDVVPEVETPIVVREKGK